ncbi:fimbria/pilus outer membrane usher protein [Glacieibacterium megasporae]|uniref:fimbria/pilus outer membrane usher protein n=1 Tax=Glacieibacterium megasporae TaxID=2835787 RepID=UPI001C1DE57B|nr:fimbria/pilus outer membrane usher protein [Polymorphobacter megasporae]UAJ10465.1 fimbria/pilus outer membrane usher protein [Polymorphobacter megasporae]
MPQVFLLVINGVEQREDATVIRLADNRIAMKRHELAGLGVPVPDGPDDDVPLDSLPGLSVAVDVPHQTLRLDFANHDKTRNRIALAPAATNLPMTPSSAGVLLNYDLELDQDRGGLAAQGLFEGRVFSQFGTLSTSALVNSRPILGQGPVIRLDTTYTVTDIARLRRYNVGDLISGGLQSSRSVRLAGFQVTTDFSVRPDLVTYPVPQLSGSAAVPSTVDILINSSKVGEGRVAAGDFAISGAPVINGNGTVDVVLRDALGRESRTTFNVYGVRTLLAPGLKSCTLDAGAVRRNYAVESNDYRFLAGTATCRAGVSDRLTVEGHAEAASDLALGGGGALFGLGRFGVVSLNASVSSAATGSGAMSGGQLAIGYELIARPISFNLSAIQATAGYRDIAARAGDPPVRSTINALIGIELGRFGSLSFGVNRGDTSAPFGPKALAFEQRSQAISTRFDRATLLTATYIANVGHGINVFANGLRDLDRRGSTLAVLGVSMVLGKRTSASGSITSQANSTDASVQLYDPVTEPGDFGYRLQADTGAAASISAQAQYQGSWGEVNAGLESVRDQVAGRAGIRGSIVFADGGVLVGNTLDNSFAIVDSGLPDVAVTRDRRPAGRTNAQGRLLVPDLRAYESNQIAIDPLSLADDALPAAYAISVRPADRIGVIARFDAHHVRAARVRLVDALGVPVAPGSRATLNASGLSVPIGYDGEAYLTGLADDNRVTVAFFDGKSCTAVFTSGQSPPTIVGPLVCR